MAPSVHARLALRVDHGSVNLQWYFSVLIELQEAVPLAGRVELFPRSRLRGQDPFFIGVPPRL